MGLRILEVSSTGKYLHVERGFLAIRYDDERIARVPLDDLGAVIANSAQLTYSNNLLIELSERGVPLVVCGKNQSPVSILWPTGSHYEESSRLKLQIALSEPKRKNAWKQIVQAKIAHQSDVLAEVGLHREAMSRMVQKVRAGDPDNLEAQAARLYWQSLFGSTFRRDADAEGTNAQLNYAYAILRSAVARAVVATGLHPGIGLHHKGPRNNTPLVDDLIEPFRPIADKRIHELQLENTLALTPETKKKIASLLYEDFVMDGETVPLSECMLRSVRQFLDYIRGERKTLVFVGVKDRIWVPENQSN